MKVLKFGGSSVANAANIKKVTEVVQQIQEPAIVVVSALGGVTDLLLCAGTLAAQKNESYKKILSELETKHLDTVRALLPVAQQSACLSLVKQHFNELDEIAGSIFSLEEFSPRTQDRMVSFGELLSSRIVSAFWQTQSMQHEWLDSRKLIRTNSQFGAAVVNFSITNDLISYHIQSTAQPLYIAPGFTGSDSQGNITTLGRGGSDYTASIYAAAIPAKSLEIWTDVSGMMTADPRYVNQARPIPVISYQEAMELSHFGAKVIYPPTIQPVMYKKIPTLVKNTFAPQDAGTLITAHETVADNQEVVKGISAVSSISLISLEGAGMVGVPGFSKRLFEALAAEKINVILITQASSEHSICVGINAADSEKAAAVINTVFESEIYQSIVEPLKIEEELAIVALVGNKMRNHAGISGKMFSALGRNGVNIRAIAQGSSERNISAVISIKDVKKSITVLHEAFFETGCRQLNLFVIGTGNVGNKLLAQIKQQQEYLLKNLNLQLRVMGISNSRKMCFAPDGKEINLSKWAELLADAPPMEAEHFIHNIISKNLRNTVVADITANEDIAARYHKLLEKSISVVACNKIAASAAYKDYSRLKSLAREYNAHYLFETNVGAGLPVISTLNDLMRSGDSITKIEAVLSGTLNFVFNNYNAKESFAAVVKRAQDEGYTEPDPRLDLGGMDVMRKILILAREAGAVVEMDTLAVNGFMPESCMNGSVDFFYAEMEKQEAHFRALYEAAASEHCKLKFVAVYENKDGVHSLSAGLQQVNPDSDFYHLYGKDNIVLFYTRRYARQPLVVKGAGAGADVTASGIFADIIRCMPVQ